MDRFWNADRCWPLQTVKETVTGQVWESRHVPAIDTVLWLLRAGSGVVVGGGGSGGGDGHGGVDRLLLLLFLVTNTFPIQLFLHLVLCTHPRAVPGWTLNLTLTQSLQFTSQCNSF